MLKWLLFLLFLAVIYLMISNDFVSTKLKIQDHQNRLDAVNLGFVSNKDDRNLSAAVNLTRTTGPAEQKTCCNSFYEISSQYSLPKLNKICDIIPTEIRCMKKCLEISPDKRKEFNLEVSEHVEEWIEHRMSFQEVICAKIRSELKLHAKQSILTQVVPIEGEKAADDQRISKEEAFNLIKTISQNLGFNQLGSFENEFLSSDPKSNKFIVNKRGIEILKQIRQVSRLLSEENKQRAKSSRGLKLSGNLTGQQLSHLNQQNNQANYPASQFVHFQPSIGFKPAQAGQPTGQQQYQPPNQQHNQHQYQQVGQQHSSKFRPSQAPPNQHYQSPVNYQPSYPQNQFLKPTLLTGRRDSKEAYEDEIDPTSSRQNREVNGQKRVLKSSDDQANDATTTVLPGMIDDSQTELSSTNVDQTEFSLIEDVQTQLAMLVDAQTEASNRVDTRDSDRAAGSHNDETAYDQTTVMPLDVTENYQCVQIKLSQLNQSVIDHLKKLYPGITLLKVKNRLNSSTEFEQPKRSTIEPSVSERPNRATTELPKAEQKKSNEESATADLSNRTAGEEKADNGNQLKARGIFSFLSAGKEVSQKPNLNPNTVEVVFNHMSSRLIEQLSSSPSHEQITQLASEVFHNQTSPCQQQFVPTIADLLAVHLRLKHLTGDFKQERTKDVNDLCNQMLEMGGKLNNQIQNCAQSAEMDYMIKHTFNDTEQGFKYCLHFKLGKKLMNIGDGIELSESVLVDHLEMTETELNQLNEINQLNQLNISEASHQLVDCLDWAKLKACQTKFIPWLQLIEVVELKRLFDNKSMQFSELHLFRENISALASSELVSAANCKDLVLFENCAKQDLEGAINVDHRTGRLIDNHNATCEIGTLRLNKISLVTSLTNKITNQINERMSPHCPKLNIILELIDKPDKAEPNAYQQNLMRHYSKKYTDIVDNHSCSNISIAYMEFCINTFNKHLKPSYVQFYKNLELQYHFGKTFVPNQKILPSICCAQRQLARCFISAANRKCQKDDQRSLQLLEIGELDYCDEINAKLPMARCRSILAVKTSKSASSSASAIDLFANFSVILIAIALLSLRNLFFVRTF